MVTSSWHNFPGCKNVIILGFETDPFITEPRARLQNCDVQWLLELASSAVQACLCALLHCCISRIRFRALHAAKTLREKKHAWICSQFLYFSIFVYQAGPRRVGCLRFFSIQDLFINPSSCCKRRLVKLNLLAVLVIANQKSAPIELNSGATRG